MLQIFNTLSRKKETFKPITEGKVGLGVGCVALAADELRGIKQEEENWLLLLFSLSN